MNNYVLGATLVLTAANTAALITGALYARKKIEEAQKQVDETKDNTNKTIKKFAQVLSEFEV